MSIKKVDIFNYAFIALPVAFASIPIYIFLPYYYHTNYGINLALLSIVLFVLRAIDAILDPLIGWYCDRFHYLSKVSLAIVIGIFIIGVYIICVPVLADSLLNLIVGIFLSTLAFSYITIFSTTKGALWLKDDDSKSSVISARETSNIVGVLVASVLLSVFVAIMPAQQGYFLYAVISIVLIIIASVFFFKWLNVTNLEPKAQTTLYSFNIRNYLKEFDKNGVFLFVVYTISAIGSTLPAVTIVFFSRYVLKTPDLAGLYIFVYFLGAILFIPIIKKIALKFGIVKTWGYALIFYAGIFSFVFALSGGDYILFTIISFLAGAGLATELILPSILLAKWIDSHSQRRKLGNGYYAILAFIAKFSYAIATLITFPLIEIPSFSTPDNIEITLRVVYCVLPCAFKIIAALIIFAWYRSNTDEMVR